MHPLIEKIFIYATEARGKGEDWLSIFKVFKEWDVNSMAVYTMLHNYFGIDSKEVDKMIDESAVWSDEVRDIVDDFFDSMEYDPDSYKDNEGKKA